MSYRIVEGDALDLIRAEDGTFDLIVTDPPYAFGGDGDEGYAEIGFDAEWACFRASDVGAPHRRERIFLLAYSDSERVWDQRRWISGPRWSYPSESANDGAPMANAAGPRRDDSEDTRASTGDAKPADEGAPKLQARREQPERGGFVGDANGEGREGQERIESSGARRRHTPMPDREALANPDRDGLESERRRRLLNGERPPRGDYANRCDCPRCYVHRFPPGPDRLSEWDGPQPAIRRGDDGVPGRTHRLRLLGNSVCPQQAAYAFQALAARSALPPESAPRLL